MLTSVLKVFSESYSDFPTQVFRAWGLEFFVWLDLGFLGFVCLFFLQYWQITTFCSRNSMKNCSGQNIYHFSQLSLEKKQAAAYKWPLKRNTFISYSSQRNCFFSRHKGPPVKGNARKSKVMAFLKEDNSL